MRLTTRTLNRTLWARQHLVPDHSPDTDPLTAVEHLLGLQAQEPLPPYLSLAARIRDFDPRTLSAAIAERRAVRLLTLRGTVHVHTPADALALRPWVQPALDRASRSNQLSRPARDVPSAQLLAAVTEALSDGPLPVAELGRRLAARFPGVPEAALRNAARERVAMVQVPPRGLWGGSGGVVYERLTTWLGAGASEPDVPELVRRYLRAFGPATPADMTTWSRVTGLGPAFRALRAELVEHTDDTGRTLLDVPDGVLADPDLDLPVVALGNYDNLWLSHADRTRIASDDARRRWTGANGGNGAAVFVDGMLEGHWRAGEVVLYRRLTRRERSGVDDAMDRVRAFLARRPD